METQNHQIYSESFRYNNFLKQILVTPQCLSTWLGNIFWCGVFRWFHYLPTAFEMASAYGARVTGGIWIPTAEMTYFPVLSWQAFLAVQHRLFFSGPKDSTANNAAKYGCAIAYVWFGEIGTRWMNWWRFDWRSSRDDWLVDCPCLRSPFRGGAEQSPKKKGLLSFRLICLPRYHVHKTSNIK